jgi:hypothetical protein
MDVAYVLKSSPDFGVEILDSKGQKLNRIITRVRLDAEPGKLPKVAVDCVDVGFDLSLDQVEFNESRMFALQPTELANVVAALQAFKSLIKGEDSRTAMLQALSHLNTVKATMLKAKLIDTLISQVSKPVRPLFDVPDDFKDVVPALVEPKVDKPLTKRPIAEEVITDPLKGVQAKV